MSKIIVIGSINVDLVILGEQIPRPGETVLGGEFIQANGGKGANQAVAAARLSDKPVTFLAAVGDDELGCQSLDMLSKENLNRDFIQSIPDRATGVALIMVDKQGENCISVASGANLSLTYEMVEPAIETCEPGDVVLACLESPLETITAALRQAKRRGATTILNPAPADKRIMDGVLEFVDVITPNITEACNLTGHMPLSVSKTSFCVGEFHERGVRDVIITMAKMGCCVSQGSELEYISPPTVDAVDTTGAGDAFNGALAVAISEGKSILDAAKWANQAASISVTRPGAQPSLPHRKELT